LAVNRTQVTNLISHIPPWCHTCTLNSHTCNNMQTNKAEAGNLNINQNFNTVIVSKLILLIEPFHGAERENWRFYLGN